MKTTLSPFRFLLYAIILAMVAHNSVAQVHYPLKQTKKDLFDSLKVLDTLVIAYKITDPVQAIVYAKRAMVLANILNSEEGKAQAYQLMGNAYFHTRKDSANFYYNLALKVAEDAGLDDRRAKILYNLAFIFNAADDKKNAIKMLDSSIHYSTAVKDYGYISNACNAIGVLKKELHDYVSARQMFDSAYKVAESASLYKQMGASLSNIALFDTNPDTSIMHLKQALGLLKKVNSGKGSEEETSLILMNIGNKFTNADSGLYYYRAALEIGLQSNLIKTVVFAYNNMAYNYMDKGNIDSAEFCLKERAIPLAKKENDHDYLSTLYDTYADVAIAKGNYKMAYEMQKKALREREVDNMDKAAGQVRLLASVLDLKNKEIMIQTEKSRSQRIKGGLIIAILLVFASGFAILVIQQRSKATLQKEQIGSARRIIEMEESEKGRIARELHDLTGQLVMGISGSIENIEFPDPEMKEMIKNNISRLGKSIRQISHRMNRAMIEHFTFSELITGLCEDVKRLSGLNIELDMPEEFPDLPNELVLHFYRITQELLTNATKYARDSDVFIRIILEQDKLILRYSDDGPGFVTDEKSRSMGVSNIHERAKLVRGRARVISAPGQGTTWEVIFPLET